MAQRECRNRAAVTAAERRERIVVKLVKERPGLRTADYADQWFDECLALRPGVGRDVMRFQLWETLERLEKKGSIKKEDGTWRLA